MDEVLMTLTTTRSTVAYFSMEICLEQSIPTYSGGLGVLAGDTLRSAADLGVPLVAVTLLHRKGYFEQHLDASGQQTEQPVHWSPEQVLEPVRHRCIFTTHTPVPAGHDKFPIDMVRHVLGDERVALLEGCGGVHEGMLNMTYLALHLTRFVNGVAMRHRDVSRGMFPGYPVNSITNGVHAVTWTGPVFAALFDRRMPEWRRDNLYLRYDVGIPLQEIRDAHAASKRGLIDEIARRTGEQLDPTRVTIGCNLRTLPNRHANLIRSALARTTSI